MGSFESRKPCFPCFMDENLCYEDNNEKYDINSGSKVITEINETIDDDRLSVINYNIPNRTYIEQENNNYVLELHKEKENKIEDNPINFKKSYTCVDDIYLEENEYIGELLGETIDEIILGESKDDELIINKKTFGESSETIDEYFNVKNNIVIDDSKDIPAIINDSYLILDDVDDFNVIDEFDEEEFELVNSPVETDEDEFLSTYQMT